MTVGGVNQRNPWLDYLKAFAIYLVIVGHVISNCMEGGAETRMNSIIYFIHIPLFLVISGLLVKDKKIGRLFWINLLRRFVVPYTVWTFILTTFYLGKTHLLNDGFWVNVEAYVANWCHSFLWFIKAYLVVYVMWQVLQKLPYAWRAVIGSAALIGVNLLVLGNSSLSEIASLSLYSYTLFAAGACLRRYMDRIGICWVVIMLLVFMMCLPFATHQNSYFECSFSHMLHYGGWHVFFIRLLAGVCISASLIKTGDMCNMNFTPPNSVLQRTGGQTLQIYMLQSLVVEGMLNRFVHFDNNFWGMIQVLAVSALATFFCLLFIERTSKSKILCSLLWGTKYMK